MKAVTPVIALVMLMLITVGSAGMAYVWFSNMMTSQTEETITIPVGGVQCINNRISAIVTNTGANSNITDDDIVVADINGVGVRNTPFFGGFNTNGLVGYWNLDNNTNDLSGYGRTLAQKNGVNCGTGVSGKFGTACNFDGNNDYMNTTWIDNLYVKATVSMWVKFDAYPVSNRNWFFWLGDTSNWWTSNIAAYMDNGAGGNDLLMVFADDRTITYSNVPISASQWHHFVFTWDTGAAASAIYMDGAQRATGATTLYSTDKDTFLIGNRADSVAEALDGVIDEAAIYNRVLTQNEITQLNKTNAGNFTLAPQKAITLINGYPVFTKGKYTVRVGTRNGVIERQVECV